MNTELLILIALHSTKFPILGESHGVCAIAGYLRAIYPNVRVKIFDLQIHHKDEIIKYIKKESPAIVGLSVKLYTFNQAIEFYNELSKLPKDHKPLIVLGNAIPTFNGEYILNKYFNDVIISIGEGEYTFEDFDSIYEILSDQETMEHYPKPFDEEKVRGWIQWNIENYAKYGFGLWAIVLKETGKMIGDCGITIQSIDGELLPEIGYHIHKKYWRKGLGSEAARAVRGWAFENTKYDCLYSYMKYANQE